MEEEAPVLLFS